MYFGSRISYKNIILFGLIKQERVWSHEARRIVGQSLNRRVLTFRPTESSKVKIKIAWKCVFWNLMFPEKAPPLTPLMCRRKFPREISPISMNSSKIMDMLRKSNIILHSSLWSKWKNKMEKCQECHLKDYRLLFQASLTCLTSI